MYCVKVLSKLSDRLDAEFYNPKAIETIELMEENGKTVELGEIIKEGYRVVYHGTDSINGLNATEVLPFLSPTQIGVDGDIDFDRVDHLPLYYRDDYPKGLASTGELLIEVKGNVSKVGIVPSAFPKNLMISGSLYKAKLNEDRMDPHYVLVFLKSKFGQILKDRLTSNTIINYIAKDALYSIPVFEASYTVQKYIGDKVRQAELLREWAKSLRVEVDNELNKFSFATDLIPSTVNKVSTQLLEDRLDPRPYRNHYINLVDQIKKVTHSKIGKLASLNSGCPVSSSDFLEEKAVPLIRIRNIGYDDFIGVDTYISKSLYEEEGKYKAEENMIVIGMDGIFRAQFILAEELPMLINQRVAILKPNEIRSELLTHWLNRPEGQMQLNQWAVKTTVEHTSLSDIGRVLIPRLTPEIEDYLADKLRNARKALKASKALAESAKYIVENLIEGEVTEDQLIQAQNALEQGDTGLDRAILSQMTEDGYAVAGSKPLFSDIDEFYDLLEQAKVLE